MPELNAVGDVVLRDPRTMLELADASRLALHDALRRGGPATARQLASPLALEDLEAAHHLEALERVGLVERSVEGVGEQTLWRAVGKGFVFEIPESGDDQRAARELSNAMMLQYVDLPRRWVREDEPRLAPAWARAAGLLNARLLVTPDELRDIQAALERVLEPYLTRPPDGAPSDASGVRVLSYFMPEPPGDLTDRPGAATSASTETSTQ
jgi:DNA-binding transcriptional ArsR family regulator